MIFTPLDTTPYIGLRAFAEDDSIYFKGREEHIQQITALLEQNKFLMVTGASGDGKSSLVYAGLVPNARAGFFRAQFPNWVVADFRPERSPLRNLSKSISKNLSIGNEESVEIELRRGFSSLVDIYRNSSLWTDDEGTDTWKQANLLIIADQFEEFFTNPENYYRNQPSADSQLVINLLLETARIALERNLPIYIVCTMRSDYIGQCASFRGLPEFVGFSQFFVPRLKRKEMIEVVREPALLHGDKISNRLVERVVYDIGEGIDQLPVLQHAMHEVWTQANNGQDELDLLHYAMAGGMAAKDLPPSDRQKFEAWFNKLPQSVQASYQAPGLARILDTHANKLFLSAAQRYNEAHSNKVSDEEAQLIIKSAFISLTKMDEGRAVRNRMTLQEITNIIDHPGIDYKIVGGVLNIFREPGNTFLRPYISDDPESKELNPDTVLDITHESLIRNWEMLKLWANEEFDNFTIYEDFKKQLDRWVDSGKSGDFLLSIGPLTYFESWYEKAKPNAYWINRYLDPGTAYDERIANANRTIGRSHDFLKKSARRHAVTRAMVRYGAGKIIGAVAALLIIGVLIYLFIDYNRKENRSVIKQVVADVKPLLKDTRVIPTSKALFLIANEAINPGTFKQVFGELGPEAALGFAGDVYTEFAWNALKHNPPLRTGVLFYIDSLLNDTDNVKDPSVRLQLQTLQAVRLAHHLYFFEDAKVKKALDRSLADLRSLVMNVLVKDVEKPSPPRMPAVDDAIELLLNYKALSTDDIHAILNSVSPFENENAKRHFNSLFPSNRQVNYNRGHFLTHYGGYQELGYLYSILGNAERVKSCMDSLFAYNKAYDRAVNNPTMMAAYLLREGHHAQVEEVMKYYAEKRNTPVEEGYELWLGNIGIFDLDFSNKLWVGENHNFVLSLQDEAAVRHVFDLYENELRKNNVADPNRLHYLLALFYKHKAMWLSKMTLEHRATATQAELKELFDLSLDEYRKVPTAYRDATEFVFIFGKNGVVLPHKDIYLYPDHAQKVRNSSSQVQDYLSTAFLNYVIDNNHFQELYGTEVRRFRSWLERYSGDDFTGSTLPVEKNYVKLTIPELEKIDSLYSLVTLEKLNGVGNHARLLLIYEYLRSGQYDKVDAVYKGVDVAHLAIDMKSWHNATPIKYNVNSLSSLINELAAYFVSQGRMDDANKLVAQYVNINNRTTAYADIARRFKRFPATSSANIFPYFDSAIVVSREINSENFGGAADPRIIVVYSLSENGDKKLAREAEEIVKQVSLNTQTDVVQNWILGTAAAGSYYDAYRNIPEISILTERLNLYNAIMINEALKTSDTAMKEYLIFRYETMYQEDYGFDVK